MTSATRRLERPLMLAGWTIVGAQIISTYVLPWVNQVFSGYLTPAASGNGAAAAGLGQTRQTMRDLVTVPQRSYDPYFGSTPQIAMTPPALPAPPSGQQRTLKDLLTMPAMPGVQRY
jgi:hypothetical protein